ncbi:TetR/AcrR family transcriptional regulator [Desertimonas flava]|uniref:TetR/AcrR family transcriptional regulator n=1 Tax=Desertimonas flava TaxID=2064846 RepID=UPI0013C4B042|nr:TetR/AcrR family transcriptional regulator [Desertimonas flava]
MSSSEARTRPSWAGVSAESRRAARRAQLLDAGFDLVGTEGSGAATVRAVCRQAGLNSRYFYENFADVDELLVAVYDRTVTELYAELAAASELAGDDLVGRFRAGIEASVRFVDEDRRRGRVLFVEARGNARVDEHRLAAWQVLLAEVRRDPMTPVRAVMLAGGFTSVLVEWLDGRLDVTRDELIDHATDTTLEIAGIDPGAGRPRAAPPRRRA